MTECGQAASERQLPLKKVTAAGQTAAVVQGGERYKSSQEGAGHDPWHRRPPAGHPRRGARGGAGGRAVTGRTGEAMGAEELTPRVVGGGLLVSWRIDRTEVYTDMW